MSEYRSRIVDEILSDKLEAKGVVVIVGPKWCGKTTTALRQLLCSQGPAFCLRIMSGLFRAKSDQKQSHSQH
jgi:predicted AAA+ superfamily ATPase